MSFERVQLTNKERYYILARDQFTCQYCGRSAPEVELHVDHLIPVARGGTNSTINLLAACDSCNLSKQAQLLPLATIRDKQQSIITRTSNYEEFLKEHPLNNEKNQPSHLNERPSALLNKYPSIAEPLKGRSLHPEKLHALKINVKEKLKIDLTYARLDKGGWVMTDIINNGVQLLLPLMKKDFEELYASGPFEEIDYVESEEISVRVIRYESGLYLIIASDIQGSVTYGLWTPLKKLDVPIEIDSVEQYTHPSDEELAYYEQ